MQLLLLMAATIALVQADDWWKTLNGVLIQSTDEFKAKIKEYPDSHLVMNFFMEYCPYCRNLQPDWNKLHDEMSRQQNSSTESKVVFLTINGPRTRKVTNKYQI